MSKLYIFFVLLAFAAIIFLISYINTTQDSLKQVIITNSNLRYIYSKNNQFIINNNLAQYSSYLIVDQNNVTIEAYVHYNERYLKNTEFGGKENFTCVLRFLLNNNDDAIFELKAVDSPRFLWNFNKKLIYNLDLKLLKKDYDEAKDRDLILNNIVVAIIWRHDYNNHLDLNNVIFVKNKRIVLPYSLIKYQLPSIIYADIPRLKTVSLCVHFAYSQVHYLKYFIDLNLSFGVREIRIYDGIDNRTLTKYLKSIYGDDDRITVVPFQISFYDLCNESVLFETFKNIDDELKRYLKNSCKLFYKTEFEDKIYNRADYEQLTSNDCFTVLKQKHEFIAYYDTDEYIYPRTMDNFEDFFNKSVIYNCDSKSRSSICSKTPLNFKYNNSESNSHFYDYVQSLIGKNSEGRDINKLGSIKFSHAATIIPSENEKKLIEDLGSFIQIKNYSSFPYKISFKKFQSDNVHLFEIRKDDIDYVRYLYKAYNSFIPCAYEGYLRKIDNKTVDTSLVRYLYYLTEGFGRMGKAIHYYKNVKSLFIHYAEELVEDNWSFHAPSLHGNFLPHYRISSKEKKNFTIPINKLKLDFEYAFFLLKNYTKFCS